MELIAKLLVGILRALAFILDIALYPFYIVLQKPRISSKKVLTKVTTESGSRMVLQCTEDDGAIDEHLEHETVYGFFENICNQRWNKRCIGVRKVFESFEGSFKGNPIVKIRKSPSYDWITYGEVIEKVDKISSGLKNMNINRGDIVMIYAETKAEWLITALACMKNGTIVSTMFTTMSLDSAQVALEETKAKFVFTDKKLLRNLNQIFQRSTKHNVKTVIFFEDESSEIHQNNFDLVPFSSLESGANNKLRSAVDPEDVAMIMYTSGTSGRPKGVIIKNKTLTHSIVDCIGLYYRTVKNPEDPSRVYIAYLPQAHILEFVQELIQLTQDCPLAFSSPRYLTDASPQVPVGEKGDMTVARPTSLVAVPLVLERFHKAIVKKVDQKGQIFANIFQFCMDYKRKWIQRGFDTPMLDRLVFKKIKDVFGGNLQQILAGGAPLNPAIHDYLNICIPGISIVQGYGLTETLGGNCLPHYSQESVGTIGHPSKSTIVALEDWKDGGYTCSSPDGPAGEIVIGGPRVADGYFNCYSEETETSFFIDESGTKWFRTGDIGRIVNGNMLAIVDRKKQLVKVQNGEYISLSKIETTLCLHPSVSMACVVTEPFRPYIAALIVVNKDNATQKSLTSQEFSKDMKEFLTNNNLTGTEIPKKYTLLADEWTPDTGMVTGAMKLRRKQIELKYKKEIEAMFSD